MLSVSRPLSLLLAITLLATASKAQAPTPNADIVKMVQAGLPESTIINKIREGAGHWDTSVDGLIALKQAGATAAELDALTAAPAVPMSTAATPAPPVNQGPSFMGGFLKRTSSGDPMFVFPSAKPSRFLDGRPSNTAFLVTYNGEPAVLIPSTRIHWGKNQDYGYLATNVLFLKTRIIFDFYEYEKVYYTYVNAFDKVKGFKNIYPEKGNPAPLEVMRDGLQLQKDQMIIPRVDHDYNSGPSIPFDRLVRGESKDGSFRFDMAFGVFAAGGPFFIQPDMHSPQLEGLVDGLMNNFDATLAGLEQVAGITDPATRLSNAAHYVPVTRQEEERYTETVKQIHQSVPSTSSGNGALALLNVMQGVTSMAQAQNQANIAAANHDMAGQMQAALNAGTAEVNMINGVSNPTAPPLIAPSGNAGGSSSPQSAISAASTAGATSYSGPNSQWVSKMLQTASYSCKPLKSPTTPNAPPSPCSLAVNFPDSTSPDPIALTGPATLTGPGRYNNVQQQKEARHDG
jgi:hypothetical protein